MLGVGKNLEKMGKKLADAIPNLTDFAIKNDKAYDALILQVQEIAIARLDAGKYYHIILLEEPDAKRLGKPI